MNKNNRLYNKLKIFLKSKEFMMKKQPIKIKK